MVSTIRHGIPEQFDIMVTATCNARCPFCVQEATYKPETSTDDDFIAGLREHFRAFYELGGRRVVITGGEPTLAMERVLGALEVLRDYPDLEVKAMYTNGSRMLTIINDGRGLTLAQQLVASGLGCVNLSVHNNHHAENAHIMGLPARMPTTQDITRHLKECGMPVRFNLTLHRGGVENYEQFVSYMEWAFAQGVTDVYVRDLFTYGFDRAVSTSDRDTLGYTARHRTNVADLITSMRADTDRFCLLAEQTEIVRDKREFGFEYLPAGKRVYLARLTIGTEDRAEIPYLIYMPDGQLYRGWLGEGDILEEVGSGSTKVVSI